MRLWFYHSCSNLLLLFNKQTDTIISYRNRLYFQLRPKSSANKIVSIIPAVSVRINYIFFLWFYIWKRNKNFSLLAENMATVKIHKGIPDTYRIREFIVTLKIFYQRFITITDISLYIYIYIYATTVSIILSLALKE